MDAESRARWQSLRVIISEIIMVITVIITVIILALLVSGYWLNSDFKVERQGMLQIHSIPTGANVAVDGDAPWFQRTNTSKVLPSGEHEIVLTKDGYDSWSKIISISEGLLYRVNYPRLFPIEREKSDFYESGAVTFATVSPDHNLILLANETTTWHLLKLDSEDPKVLDIDMSKLTNLVSVANGAKEGLFTGEIISANWDSNCEHILFEFGYQDTVTEWVLLDISNPVKSININREFAIDFSAIRIFDNASNNLLGLSDGTLRKIDVSGRQISAPIATSVRSYDFYNSEIIYATDYAVYLTKIGDSDTPNLLVEANNAQTYLSRFYDDEYFIVIAEGSISLYKKDNPSDVLTKPLDFKPVNVKIGDGGSFVFMQSGKNVSVLDMETLAIVNWTLDSPNYGWLDSGMIYSVSDGMLIVYDYDGLNRRELSSGVSSRYPVTITNNKWLYYFSDGVIMREVIVP